VPSTRRAERRSPALIAVSGELEVVALAGHADDDPADAEPAVSYGQETPYLPVIDLLKGYFQIADQDDHRKIHEKLLAKLVRLDESLRSALPSLLTLLDVPVEDTDNGAALDDQPAVRLVRMRQLPHYPRLTHARLADHCDHLAAARRRAAECPVQLL
jgi:hypothetical protein